MLHMALSTVNIVSITQQHTIRNLEAKIKNTHTRSICYILKLNAFEKCEKYLCWRNAIGSIWKREEKQRNWYNGSFSQYCIQSPQNECIYVTAITTFRVYEHEIAQLKSNQKQFGTATSIRIVCTWFFFLSIGQPGIWFCALCNRKEINCIPFHRRSMVMMIISFSCV